MPIEEEIKETIKKFAFNRTLPEFIDRAKYLEGRLKEGESLSVGMKELAHSLMIYLDFYETGKNIPQRAIQMDCFGNMVSGGFFEDYKPLPESQRE